MYNNKCQICWESIKINNDQYYSEWHHIKPLWKNHNWPDTEENIIILCPNHHAEFDYWVIAINPINNNILSTYNINNLKLNERHKLKREFLEYHINNIYKTI